MCVSPTLIKNPNYGYKGRYSFLKDTVSPYIKVPCGVCSECVHMRQISIVQRCIAECISGWPFFCTLTYKDSQLPYIGCSDGWRIPYADFSDFTNMLKRIRKNNLFGRRFRYFAVSELGSKRGRPHFHVIFFLEKFPSDTVYTPLILESQLYWIVFNQWMRNYGSSRKPDYQPLCDYVSKWQCGKLKCTYDFHWIQPAFLNGSTIDVPFYVTKYMLKPSSKAIRLQQALRLNLSEDEYNKIWSIVKPRWISSLNFGFGIYGLQAKGMSRVDRLKALESTEGYKLVKQSISRSLSTSDYPCFFEPESGKPLALARYWKTFGNLFTEQDALSFFYKAPHQTPDNVSIDDRDLTSKYLSIAKHKRQLSQIEQNEENLETLFD